MKQKFELCDWLDNQAKLFTIKDLHEKLCSISKNGEDIYSLKRMKQKLEDHNGETFFFTNLPGSSNTVCLKDTTSEIINDKWYEDRKENLYEEKSCIISAAAKLTKNEVRCTKLNIDFHRNPGRYWSGNRFSTTIFKAAHGAINLSEFEASLLRTVPS